MKRTKIIATLWPVTNSREKLIDLYKAWVNIIRFNFSHANHEDSLKTANLIKELNSAWLTNLSLLLDTKWPEIRTWDVKEKINFETWEIFKIYSNFEALEWERSLFCDYPFLAEDIQIGKNIILDSGLLNVEVLEKYDDYVLVKALNSALIWSRRHINLPWVRLRLPWVTEKDREDILWWIKNWFSFIAASFIRNAWNVEEMRNLLNSNWWENIKIISKVENEEAIDNLDEIIMASDWVMVARWDLWIEVPIQKLAVYQKQMVDKCKENGKIVVVATHLLETMIENPFPTRAESSDVYNATLQKPDCLMLSWETAIWKFPVESVKMMTSLIEEAEKNMKYDHFSFVATWLNERDIEKKLLIRSWIFIWEELWAKAVIVLTKSWLLARLASAFRPEIKTYAFTNSQKTVSICNSFFWIEPIYLESWDSKNYTKTLEDAIKFLNKKGLLNYTDKLIAINDIQRWDKEIPVMEIISVKDIL